MWTSFVNLFLNLLLFIYKIVGNFGVAIIIFTVLIKLLTHPLMQAQIKSSNAMAKMQKDPEYLEIMEKYKNDKERLAQEQMKMYQKMGVNPTASCLPTLIQLPIIFALYQAVIAAIVSTPIGMIDLIKRVIPSWIKVSEVFPINPNFLWMNLGMPERLMIGNFGLPVLAILVVITTVLQSRLTMPEQSKDENGGSAAMMTGMMNIYMPLLMGFMAYSLASGLALYFLISNIFTICQYAVLGTLHWENLKFWGKKKAVAPAAKGRGASVAAPKKASAPAPAASSAVRESEPAAKPKTSSAKSSDDDNVFSQKIDYTEFKKHKKPKKK